MITLNVEKQGESIRFLTDADGPAARAEVEVRLAPGASGPPPHRHTRQHETFQVISGQMVAKVDGREHTLEAGGTLVVRPGQAHTFTNGSPTEPLLFRAAVEPALGFPWFLSEMAKSAIRAGGSWKDVPLLEAAYILHQVRDEYRVAGIPTVVQDILFGTLARVAVAFGRTREITPRNAGPARAPVQSGPA